MSQPSRPWARGPAEQRRRREIRLDHPTPLEDRRMPAPVVAAFPLQAIFTAAATPTNSDLGTVTVTTGSTTLAGSAAPITSVAELTPNSAFGGDIVNIAPGPGGVFGSAIYAISRGSGGNPAAINRPGVIYRVDPATGKTSVFFDLNTVLAQTDPTSTTSSPAGNSFGPGTGLVNWYSMTFDPQGQFDGTPSLFVSSVDQKDPNKNIIFQISPSGQLIGVFVQMTNGLSAQKFNLSPTAILIPPIQDQQFLSGMIAGSGISSTSGKFAALYFNSSAYSPGQVISDATEALPTGVSQTELGLPVSTTFLTNNTTISSGTVNTGPIVGLTASNSYYGNQIFSVFTDFGTPAGGGIPAKPGFSGVQGSNGGLLLGATTTLTTFSSGTSTGSGNPSITDNIPAVSTLYRRFYGIAFDQYGYFSQGLALTATSTAAGGTGTSSTTSGTTTYTLGSGQPAYMGSLFVSDLASSLYVSTTPLSPLPTSSILVPVSGSGILSVTTDSAGNVIPSITSSGTASGSAGGRIIRIQPNGVATLFAYGFNVSPLTDYTSFQDSTLSIGFSADGTILYAADNSGIWQFKTTADLADSTSGALIGLSDLRALGAPYDGQNAAVAVVDTGVDAKTVSFRGRVATGFNVTTGGAGNSDLTPLGTNSSAGAGGVGGAGGIGGGAGGIGGGGVNTTTSLVGHGTPVAGVIAQFVPQATILPIDIFNPFAAPASVFVGISGGALGGIGGGIGGGAGGIGGGAGGIGGGTGSGTGILTANDGGASSDTLYNGLQYLIQHPFVNDPLRPSQVSRVIAAVNAFGTPNTFKTEAEAYKQFPQVVVALKNQYHKLRKEGIASIAATGQFGAPLLSGPPISLGGIGGGIGSGAGGIGGGAGGIGGGAGGIGGGAGGIGGGAGGAGGATGSANILAQEHLPVTNSAAYPFAGDTQGISMPAIFNEVISVTGVYSFPFKLTPSTSPIDTPTGVIPQPTGPVLLFGNLLTIAGQGASGGTGGTGGAAGGGTGTGASGNASLLAAGDTQIWVDRIPGSVNRNFTTDFAAPAFNVPTFSRTFTSAEASSASGGTGGTAGGAGAGTSTGVGGGSTTTGGAFVSNPMTFNQVGTSMSAAIVTGSYAMVSSALNYWIGLARSNGYTADAYLNTKVGTTSLNFGPHAFKNLSAYNNPDGINSILAWTAVPATDVNSINTISTPAQLPNSTAYPSYARVSVGNAIAAIEGTQAINYLNKHHDWQYIDTSHTGLITAQELQTFTDNAAAMGMPEAGAMAALLGGTATYGPVQAGINNTVFNENPDSPGVQQRRFNFFDYAADGQLNGSISVNEFKMLGRILLPSPNAFAIIDRQRAASNGFLLAPSTPRNFAAIKYLQPSFLWIPKGAIARYRNLSPAQFTVGRGLKEGTYLPLFTLFDPSVGTRSSTPDRQVVGMQQSAFVNGARITVNYMVNVPNRTATPTSSPSPTSTTSSTSTTSPTATGQTSASTTSSQATTTTTTTTPTTTTTTTATTSPTTTPPVTAATSPATTTTGSSGASTKTVSTSTSSTQTVLAKLEAELAALRAKQNASTSTSTTSASTTTPSSTIAPLPVQPITSAPLAYSSGPATVAASPHATAVHSLVRIPRAERQAVQRYLQSHKKSNQFDRFWTDIKKSLGIK